MKGKDKKFRNEINKVKNSKIMIISNIEAAKLQIDTAIELYFIDKDSVSIHTLVCSAHEILRRKLKDDGIDNPSLLDELIKPSDAREIWDRLNKSRVFFKHFLGKKKGSIDFNPDVNEEWLLDCCLMYKKISNGLTNQMKVYVTWFKLAHPDLLVTEELSNLASKMHREYKTTKDYYNQVTQIIK